MAEDISQELQNQFRDGASVSQLIRIAQERLGPHSGWRDWTRAIREAFALSPSGWAISSESFGNPRVPDWNLSLVFLRAILQNRPAWDSPRDERCWFDRLEKTPIEQHHAEARRSRAGLSQAGWDALTADDQDTVCLSHAMHASLSEDLALYSALIEQLQQRVTAAENPSVADTHATHTTTAFHGD